MASLRKRGKVWYYRYVDSDGVKKEAKGCSDKRATEELARLAESEAAKIRAGVLNPRDLAFHRHESIPLAQHLKDFESSLLAKGGTRKHALVTFHRAERVLELAKARRISDLSLSKAQEALGALRAVGLGQETINHHVRAVKAFSRWLWKDSRCREHALAHLATSSPEADRRRKRRALTSDEAARLIRAAESGPTVKGLDGRDRAVLYALALGSGFRSEELRTLTPEWFHLDSVPPTVTVLACYAKNGHEAAQPIPSSLADRLRPWLVGKAPGQPVFGDLTDRTAEMLRVDLVAAGIVYETSSGVIDFHALRSTYVSHLVSSGASVKTCQVLARHSTPSLTIGLYAKASLHDVRGAVESLPDLNNSAPSSESLAATGTAGERISEHFAHYLPTGGGGPGPFLAEADGQAPTSFGELSTHLRESQPLKMTGVGDEGRDLTVPVASAGGGNRTHTG